MNPLIILELPHQTPTGMYRAVIWDRDNFTTLDIVEACTFTEASLLSVEMYPSSELSEAAIEQLHEEQLMQVAA